MHTSFLQSLDTVSIFGSNNYVRKLTRTVPLCGFTVMTVLLILPCKSQILGQI